MTVTWTEMRHGSREDYDKLADIFEAHARQTLTNSLLAILKSMKGPLLGYQIDREHHSRQAATRALRNDESDEFIVATLLHDIGDIIAPHNHSAIAADILAPFVSEEITWVIRHHGLFQGYYYFHHIGGDQNARERYRESAFFDRCADFCEYYDQNSFDPDYDTLPLAEFVPLVDSVLAKPSRLGPEWNTVRHT